MTYTLPAPGRNVTSSGLRDRATDVATSSTIKVASGDYTGGASDDMFTLASHGLETGNHLHVLWQSATGAATGGEGLHCLAKKLSSSTFQITDLAGTVIENTADGTVVFLVADAETSLVEIGIIPNIIVGAGVGATDVFTPAQGTKGLDEADSMVLLYKSAAGVVLNTSVDTTCYAKTVTATTFKVSATSGGAALDNSADGTAVFLKTS